MSANREESVRAVLASKRLQLAVSGQARHTRAEELVECDWDKVIASHNNQLSQEKLSQTAMCTKSGCVFQIDAIPCTDRRPESDQVDKHQAHLRSTSLRHWSTRCCAVVEA